MVHIRNQDMKYLIWYLNFTCVRFANFSDLLTTPLLPLRPKRGPLEKKIFFSYFFKFLASVGSPHENFSSPLREIAFQKHNQQIGQINKSDTTHITNTYPLFSIAGTNIFVRKKPDFTFTSKSSSQRASDVFIMSPSSPRMLNK